MEKNINRNLNNNDDDLIEIIIIYNFFKRNIKSIFSFTFLGIIIFTAFSFTLKKTWKGEFQIVMEEEKGKGMSSVLSQFRQNEAALSFLTKTSTATLETQEEILKSPSILIDIFEFVKKEKIEKNKSLSNLSFDDWKKQLKIGRTKRTSVLNLSYIDKDKFVILPTLKKISASYQEYSRRDKKRMDQLAYDFLKEQRSIYFEEAKNSINKFAKFSSENNIYSNVEFNEEGKGKSEKTNIELITNEASDKIKLFEEQLKSIRNLDYNSDKILFAASEIPPLEATLGKTLNIENELRLKLNFYKDNDPYILMLKRQKDSLLRAIKDQVIDFYLNQIELNKGRIQAVKTSEDILEKFRNLSYKKNVDKSMFQNIDQQFQIISLERQRSIDPWELITEPTLLPSPVAPSKSLYFLSGGFFGLFIGIIYSLLREKGILKNK